MKIKCITNSAHDLPKDLYISGHFEGSGDYSSLKRNSLHTVYAMSIFYDYVWFYIHNASLYPIAYPSSFFDVIDQKISKCWIYYFKTGENKKEIVNFWSFPEWANEPGDFYEALLEDYPKETKIYQNYKLLMDLEFPNLEIDLKAEKLEDNWLMCPICIDAWQTDSKAGMVICPKCKNIMHNSNYSD
jgi:hypothetical protein